MDPEKMSGFTAMNNTTLADNDDDGDDEFSRVIDNLNTVLSLLGVMLNATALIAFIKNGKSFGFPIKNLLLHQTFLDLMACLLSTIIHLQPSYWHVSNYYWELINCYLWHSQYFFWYLLYTSANNLVYLAYDRYRAVVHPLHYKDISKSRVYMGFFFVHLYSFLARWPNFFMIKMENGVCIAGWVFKGRYGKLTADIYAVVEFFVHYLFHMVAFTIFYGRVIQTSNKVLKRQEDTTSASTQKALWVVTKAAIAMTVAFIITFSWNSWNYTLGVFYGWFLVGSPWQKTNVIMVTINSACNPIFYLFFMPSFRHAVFKTFLPCTVMYNSQTDQESSQGNTSLSAISKS